MTENHSYRMAALKLHGLHPRDRSWLLGHLEQGPRHLLQNLIKELDALGLVPAAEISAGLTTYPVGNYILDEDAVRDIQQTHAELVWKNFAPLPERLKAILLHAYRWQWTALIQDKLEPHEQSRLLRHMAQLDPLKPAVCASLVQAFAAALRQTGPYGDSSHAATGLDT